MKKFDGKAALRHLKKGSDKQKQPKTKETAPKASAQRASKAVPVVPPGSPRPSGSLPALTVGLLAVN